MSDNKSPWGQSGPRKSGQNNGQNGKPSSPWGNDSRPDRDRPNSLIHFLYHNGSTTCCPDVAKKGDFHINLFWLKSFFFLLCLNEFNFFFLSISPYVGCLASPRKSPFKPYLEMHLGTFSVQA